MPLLSDRVGKTSEVVVLPASTEDPNKPQPGLVRIGLFLTCGSVAILFASLVFAYYWRKTEPGLWQTTPLPGTLWLSTLIIAMSSLSFELARRNYGRGDYERAAFLLQITGVLGLGFLASQAKAWLQLIDRGAYLQSNPYSGFFYLFTGLHAAHLIGGLAGIGIAIFSSKRRREIVDAAAYYWHFLGILWVALFFVLAH